MSINYSNDLYIVFNIKGNSEIVSLDKINYIINNGRKILVYTVDSLYKVYGSIKKTLPWLDKRFHLCHSNLIVNLSKISSFGKDKILFKNGDNVNIGVHNLRNTRHAFKNFMEAKALKMRIRQMNKNDSHLFN